MEFYKEIKINSLDDMKEFAKNLNNCLKGNELILLIGDLASGKTTFTKFLVSSLGIEDESEITSPTFTVMNEYETDKGTVYHIDLYRVKNFDITDILGYGIVLIEWGNEIDIKNIDVPVIKIEFKISGEESRILKISLQNAEYIKECV